MRHRENTLSICLGICFLQSLTQVAWKGDAVFQDRQEMCSFPGSLLFTHNEPKYLGCRRRNGFYPDNQILQKTNTLHIHKKQAPHCLWTVAQETKHKIKGRLKWSSSALTVGTDHWVFISVLSHIPLKKNYPHFPATSKWNINLKWYCGFQFYLIEYKSNSVNVGNLMEKRYLLCSVSGLHSFLIIKISSDAWSINRNRNFSVLCLLLYWSTVWL